MNTHSIDLIRYCARSRGNSTIYLGTAGSHGNEQLQVTLGKGWEGLTVQVVFHPCKVAVQLPANGVLDVPWEATARPLTALQGRIVFQGFDQDRLVNSTDLAYTVASHSPALGRDEQPYTPGIVEGVLNQMAADKDVILQAAQQTGQAKEAAAASAAEAASSAANAQQSAGAANTSAGQAAASASQAAGSAAAANETLTQVQTAGQEAQQKVKDAEAEALDKIAAAAPALPAVSTDAAWQSVTVKPDGTGYNLAALAPIEATIRPTVTGNPAVCENSAAWGLQGLKIYGKSVQSGIPSLENPAFIVNTGDGGHIDLTLTGANLFDYSAISDKVSEKGITIVNNHDGTFTVSGIKTDDGGVNLSGGQIVLPPGTYTLSGSNDPKLYVVLSYPGGLFQGNTTKTFSSWTTFTQIIQANKTDDQTVTIKPMLNIGAVAASYKPYQSQSLTISTPNSLPGIPVESGGNYVDAEGQQWISSVADLNLNILSKPAVQVIFDGTENWIRAVNSAGLIDYRYQLPDGARSAAICNAFQYSAGDIGTGFWIAGASGNIYAIFKGTNCETLTKWVALLKQMNEYGHPLKMVYALSTSITTPLSDEEIAAYRALQTYDGTTVVSTTEPVAGLEVQYMMDGNKYRESVDKRLAALEAAQTGI